jgi:indolepyruvate ferredoxin oxidoreductase beta subunit
MTPLPDRPITILVAALGGEGGSVLADWIVDAAVHEGFPAQATSIPGLAQRTGATTYYLEIFAIRRDALGGREPVMSLTPGPGNVDIIVASELIEAGQAMQNGYVSPERTTLVASTHRVYVASEVMHTGDGRYDSARVLGAARKLAKRAVLFDMRAIAQAEGTVINAVLFGAMAGAGALPLPRATCEEVIRRSGRGAEASLRGFDAGFRLATQPSRTDVAAVPKSKPTPDPRVAANFPREVHEVLSLAVARLIDYQDESYAGLYLERMKQVLAADTSPGNRLTSETGRHLALWMSYEDVIRVADLKTRASRFKRIREDVGATPDAPVVVVDYLKPGVEEFASLLPPALGARLLAWAKRTHRLHRLNIGLKVRTSSVLGYLLMRVLARLKLWRPRSYRYAVEQQLIERWLATVRSAAKRDAQLALEITECARLIKGYSDMHRRGAANFLGILDGLARAPAIGDPREQARAIACAREAALADPDGKTSSANLGRQLPAGKPVADCRNPRDRTTHVS